MPTNIPSSNLSGQLLRIRSGLAFADVAEKLPSVTKVTGVGPPGWTMFQWVTEKEVVGTEAVRSDGQFVYPLYVREVEDRFMVLSIHSDVVQHFLVLERLGHAVEKPVVNINAIVKDALFPAESRVRGVRYRLGAMYAAVEGFGRSLRSMSLYGDDLANAALLRDMLPHLNPYRITLRQVTSDLEVTSVSAQGEISFYYKNADSLAELERALGFLRRNGYLVWRRRAEG